MSGTYVGLRWKCLMVGFSVSLLSVGSFGLTTDACAHGPEHQPSVGETADHMEAMARVKAQIPEEYRLMNRTPVTPSSQSLARGKELYAEHCAVCHGQDSKGDGPAAKGMATRPANFLDLEHSSIYGPGEKFWLIGNGATETGMPGFAAQIPAVDRWHLVNFILSLQVKAREAR